MRFIYIILDNTLTIEVQQNRDKLSPFIRQKNKIENLVDNLFFETDKTIYQYIKFLNQTYPPYTIDNLFISEELITLIKKADFIFFQKNKKASLKRLKDYSLLFRLENSKNKLELTPIKIKILINKILQHKVSVSYFLQINGTQYNIPIEYNFIIPLLDAKEIGYISQKKKEELFNKFYEISNQNILDSSYLDFNNLNRLNENNMFDIQYKSSTKNSKSISFSSNKLFKMNIFDKDNLKYDDLDFYYIILQNYLQNKNYVEYDGELLLLDEKNLIEDIDSKTILKAFSYGIDKNIELFIEKLLHLKNNINKEKIINKLESVKFKAKLKDYQEDGVLWLYNLYKNKIDGGLLADEMGLGKTIQVIAFLLLSNKKKVLIISPASLTHNWKNEISKFTNIDENGINLSIDESFITILSYETARSKIEQLKEINYDILIMDESQKIKNHKTQIFNAVSQIKRNFTIIMTGTPIENSLNDLWNMLFTINPALHKLYSKKIEPLLTDIENYEKATTLTVKMLYPIMLQRRKEDVLDLPPRDTKTLFLEFSKEEKKRYINLTNTFISAIKSGLSGRVQSIALEGLLRLRQFCSIHSIVPETLIDTNSLIDTKVEKSIELVDKALSQNEKIIIFSQFTSSLDKLEIMLNKKNFNYLRLDGSTTKANRNKIVNKFQEKDNKYSIFLISLKAGGVGLNLTSATNAILFEPWWNPAVEEQAFARIDRIGQDKKTKIYRLIYKDSIEEKINKLIEQKQNIFSNMTNLLVNRKSLEMEVARDIFRIS